MKVIDTPLSVADKHQEQIADIRAKVWKLQDRVEQIRRLEANTRRHAERYYASNPRALERIDAYLGRIFADLSGPHDIDAAFGVPQRLGELLSHTPCFFTFFPGLGTHRSVSQYDLVLVDRFSTVRSRSDVNLCTDLTPAIPMSAPFLASNMRAVIGEQLAERMIERGLIPVMHRFRRPLRPEDVDSDSPTAQDPTEALREKIVWAERYGSRAFFSCGTTWESIEFAKQLVDRGVLGICVDIALGNSEMAVAAVLELKQHIAAGRYTTSIMAGNVDTAEGYLMLAYAGADVVKCGIGPGSPCTTRVVTRAGAGQGSALMDVSRAKFIFGDGAPSFVADGGVDSSADVLVALALGASGAMSGKLFAACTESAALKKQIDGALHAFYFGEASRPARLLEHGSIKPGTTVEGSYNWIPCSGTVDDLLSAMEAGLRNAFPYYNSRTIEELQQKYTIAQQLCDLILGGTTGIYESGANHALESGPRLVRK